MRVITFLGCLLILSACNPLVEITKPFRSEAYKIGYETGVEMKDISAASDSINDFARELNEWTGSDIGEFEDVEFDVRGTCESLFELTGLISSLQGLSIDNTQSDRDDFTLGCVDGYES
jgi:hypothetical protein